MATKDTKYHSVNSLRRETLCNMKIETLDKISRFLAETIGTGLITFAGCGCTVQWGAEPPSHLQVVLGFGMVIMFIIQIFGHISAAHLNPAITISALIQKKVDVFTSCYYIIAQLIGGFVGFGLLKVVTPESIFKPAGATVGTCSTVLHPELSPIQGVAIEFLATSIIVLVFCAILDHRCAANTDSLPLRFGFVVFVCALFTGQATGGSFNPARSLGPAIWNGDWEHHWVYWVGPLAAGVFTTLMYKAVFSRPPPEEEVVRSDDIQLSNNEGNKNNPA